MMKKLVISLAFLGLVLLTSCTSKDSQPESGAAADYESADLEKLEGDEALEVAGADNATGDQLPETALGETTASVETITDTNANNDTNTVDSVASTEKVDASSGAQALPADPFAESKPPAEISDNTTTTIVDAPTEMAESTIKESSVTDAAEPKKSSAPLQKVATTPWKVGRTLFNTVYFARPGDTLKSISQMLYGSNKVSELKKGNPTFNSRGVKPGDKVYYNSPHRSDDATRIITYYEDNGIAPEIYVAKAGDNLRGVAPKLLGYDQAWKEIWASNSLESKQAIPEGTELKYWKGGPVAAAPAPQSELAASQPPVAEPPPMEMGQNPPAPPAPGPEVAANELPPPPPMPDPAMDASAPPPPPPMDMAQQEMPPPPPPAPADLNPPPPPHATADEAPQGMDGDTTMALGVVGVAAAGAALLIVMRKKRKQKELEQQGLDNTHVGT